MKKFFLLLFLPLIVNAKFFFFKDYLVDKNPNDITSAGFGQFQISVFYNFVRDTKQSLIKFCTNQKEPFNESNIECKKNSKGNYDIDYIKMTSVINIKLSKICILKIFYYDSKNNILSQHNISQMDKCQWMMIKEKTSSYAALKYLIDHYS